MSIAVRLHRLEGANPRQTASVNPDITAMLHAIETGCGCRGEVAGEIWVTVRVDRPSR